MHLIFIKDFFALIIFLTSELAILLRLFGDVLTICSIRSSELLSAKVIADAALAVETRSLELSWMLIGCHWRHSQPQRQSRDQESHPLLA